MHKDVDDPRNSNLKFALSIIKREVKIMYGEGICLCFIWTERNLGPIKMQKRTNFIINNYGQIIILFSCRINVGLILSGLARLRSQSEHRVHMLHLAGCMTNSAI